MIGIICAIPQEFNEIKRYINDEKVIEHYQWKIYIGTINNKQVVLILSGVGKVNAALATCMLIENFKITMVITIGLAGRINPELLIGDIVIGNELQYHDSVISESVEKIDGSEYSSHMTKQFRVDSILKDRLYDLAVGQHIELPKAVCLKTGRNYPKVWVGKMVSGDMPVDTDKKAMEIKESFNPLCVDMESSSVFHTCTKYNMDVAAVRIISDNSNEQSAIYLMRYGVSLCKYLAQFICGIIDKM